MRILKMYKKKLKGPDLFFNKKKSYFMKENYQFFSYLYLYR